MRITLTLEPLHADILRQLANVHDRTVERQALVTLRQALEAIDANYWRIAGEQARAEASRSVLDLAPGKALPGEAPSTSRLLVPVPSPR